MVAGPSRRDLALNAPLERSAFALESGCVYLNSAAGGPLPVVTRDAIVAAVLDQAARGILGVAKIENQLDASRVRVGAMIGASGEDIAFLRNTTDGANVVARGLDWRSGDEIVICDNEFGANAMPWLALREFGVVVRFIETARERMTPEVLERITGARTRLVAVSWVSFADGYRHDLAALAKIAHARGALFCVDAAQALGAFGVDVRACAIDALYTGAQKWLLGLAGTSFLYVDSALRERLHVRWRGWRDVADIWDFLAYDQPLSSTAGRYEGGTQNFLGVHALARSVEVLCAAGLERIAEHVLALSDYAVAALQASGAEVVTPRGPGISSGIVTFRLPGRDSVALGRSLGARKIVTTYRASGIRISLHGFNTKSDVDTLMAALVEDA
ncbi:MAG: aminotransferase class V-fold PLP-dependent enzyme [Candidatus Baltobacteraceae bacterium]